jgi:hypothetical protein
MVHFVFACGALAAVLLTFALVREVRRRRAFAKLLAIVLNKERRPHDPQSPASLDGSGDRDNAERL